MRSAAIGLAGVLAACLGYAGYAVTAALAGHRERRRSARARWRVRHYGAGGATVVAVGLALPDGKVTDEHVVARIDDSAPDWDVRFVHARALAEERAFHLNADRQP